MRTTMSLYSHPMPLTGVHMVDCFFIVLGSTCLVILSCKALSIQHTWRGCGQGHASLAGWMLGVAMHADVVTHETYSLFLVQTTRLWCWLDSCQLQQLQL